MQKLPVLKITKEAYNFLFSDIKKILPMFGQYGACMILLYILLHLMRDHLHYPASGTPGAFTLAVMIISTFLLLLLQMPMNISVVRAVAKGEEVGNNFFNLLATTRTRKAFVTMLAVVGLIGASMGGIIIPLFALLAAFYPSQFHGNEAPLIAILPFIVAIIPTIYIGMRIFLAVPSAALDHDRPIRHSWGISKGHLIRLFAIALLTSLPSVVWAQAVALLFNVTLYTNPLLFGLLSLPQLYLGLLLYTGLGLAYKQINK